MIDGKAISIRTCTIQSSILHCTNVSGTNWPINWNAYLLNFKLDLSSLVMPNEKIIGILRWFENAVYFVCSLKQRMSFNIFPLPCIMFILPGKLNFAFTQYLYAAA